MSLEETIKSRIKQAMKDHDETARDVLRVVLGQIQLESSEAATTEEQKLSVVRKLIKSNQLTLASMGERPVEQWSSEWTANADQLKREIVLLESLLPKTWSGDEIAAFIREKGLDVVSPRSDGQAMGAVMKELKAVNAPVDSATVKATVEAMRRPAP
jgi:uncharacterized protein YqeY